MDEATEKYGIRPRTGKPIRIACADLSQAINALKLHADEEVGAFQLAYDETAASVPDADHGPASAALQVIASAAEELRKQRNELLEVLLPIREPLVDALLEEADSRPGGLQGGVAPWNGTVPAPRPLSGLELTFADRVRVLGETFAWTQRTTHSWVLQAIGPAYALGVLIAHPTPEAKLLREAARDAHKRFLRLAMQPVIAEWRL